MLYSPHTNVSRSGGTSHWTFLSPFPSIYTYTTTDFYFINVLLFSVLVFLVSIDSKFKIWWTPSNYIQFGSLMQFTLKIYHFYWHSFAALLYSFSSAGVVIVSTLEAVRRPKGAHLNQGGKNDKRKHYASLNDITYTALLSSVIENNFKITQRMASCEFSNTFKFRSILRHLMLILYSQSKQTGKAAFLHSELEQILWRQIRSFMKEEKLMHKALLGSQNLGRKTDVHYTKPSQPGVPVGASEQDQPPAYVLTTLSPLELSVPGESWITSMTLHEVCSVPAKAVEDWKQRAFALSGWQSSSFQPQCTFTGGKS